MHRFSMTNLALMMTVKVSQKEIEKIMDKLDIQPSGNMALASEESANLAALQLLRRHYTTLSDYIIDMNLYVSDAVNRRAQLVCFPAYTGILPASFLPQYENHLAKLKPQANGLPDIQQLNDCLSAFSDVIFEAYYHTLSLLAARHQVYIMSGSILYYDNETLRHRAFLFNDKGDVVGYQDKISQNALERELQVEAGSELKLFETPLGPLCILIGNDVDYFEIARSAKNMGAKLLLNPTVYTQEYTPIDAAVGLNLRVQETGLYGVQSVMVGDTDLGFTLEGPSCVFAPTVVSNTQNGVLFRGSGRFEPDIVAARLNMDKLSEAKNPYLQDKNLEIMKYYVDRLY